jgi:hypothetical protein
MILYEIFVIFLIYCLFAWMLVLTFHILTIMSIFLSKKLFRILYKILSDANDGYETEFYFWFFINIIIAPMSLLYFIGSIIKHPTKY